MKSVFIIFLVVIFISASLQTLRAQWIKQSSGTDVTFTDVVMLDSTTAIAVGRNGSILRTTNSGETWFDEAAILSYIQPWNSISFLDDSSGCVAGDHGVILTTQDEGKSWRWHQIPADQKCLSVLQIGKSYIYVGTDSGWVFISNDTAKTWSGEKISNWPIRSIFGYRGNLVAIYPIPYYALTSFSICAQYSPDPWAEDTLLSFQGLGSEARDAEYCYGGGPGFIVGVQGDLWAAPTILRTKSMWGIQWVQISTGIHQDGVLNGVSAPSEKVIYVCGSGGMIYKSTDTGDSWLKQDVSTTQNINAIYFFDEKRGFAVGDSGLILHTSSGGLTGIDNRNNSLPAGFELKQNYPNPFNPATVIGYQLSVAGWVTLKIYDVLGREVATLVNEYRQPGLYHSAFSTLHSAFSSGVYFYRLTAGEYSSTKKMVLLK